MARSVLILAYLYYPQIAAAMGGGIIGSNVITLWSLCDYSQVMQTCSFVEWGGWGGPRGSVARVCVLSSCADDVRRVGGAPRAATQREPPHYREQIARISRAERRPPGCPAAQIKPLISILEEKKKRQAAATGPVCFASQFPAARWYKLT